MGTKLTHASRTELADSLRQRYQSSSGKTNKLIQILLEPMTLVRVVADAHRRAMNTPRQCQVRAR